MQIDAAHKYIRSLRKPSKRTYAEHYWAWLVHTTVTNDRPPEPERSCLSVMAAQAVRMHLRAFTE